MIPWCCYLRNSAPSRRMSLLVESFVLESFRWWVFSTRLVIFRRSSVSTKDEWIFGGKNRSHVLGDGVSLCSARAVAHYWADFFEKLKSISFISLFRLDLKWHSFYFCLYLMMVWPPICCRDYVISCSSPTYFAFKTCNRRNKWWLNQPQLHNQQKLETYAL